MAIMLHLDPSEISNWADLPDANHQLPELIRRLILATTVPTHLDIPGGSAVWRSGWDGLVAATVGNAWAPKGVSVWELSCQKDPGAKASADYRKRTDDPQGVAPADATFAFVTPRLWSGKQNWVKQRRGAGEWAEVRAFDASDLATWLEQAPAVAAWFARLIGKLPAGGYTTLEDWWQNWAAVSQPNISPQLVLAGRQESANKLGEWMQQPPAHYYVQGQTREEAIAFVAASTLNSDDAWAAALLAKALLVKSEDAWHSLTSQVSPLVLLRAFDGNASPQVTVRRGHHVITPLYASEEPRGNGTNGTTLRRLGRDETITALTGMGLSETGARALARKTARMLPIIRRSLIDEAGGPRPAWASPTANAAQSALPALVLVGQWNELNEADQEAIAHIAATPYDGIANEVTNLAQTEDSPLTKIGAHWRFLGHEEAWHLLAPRLTATTIKRFQETATAVLSAVSPKFGMPISERHLAGIRDQTLPHSDLLRDGIARALALMGSQGERAQNVPNASDVPERILQRVFAENAGWEIWATIDKILPTLAEAAPEAVLSAIEQRMAATPNPFGSLFAQEGDPLFGGSVHTGLLWALERLAWTPEYFTRTAAILAQLATIDPGGTISNRPARSLTELFLPWFRVSETLDAHRLETLETLLKRYPEPSWQALINAYPSTFGTVTGREPPSWRPWGQDGATRPTQAEYKAFVEEMERLLLEYVGCDACRWQALVGIMDRLSTDAYQKATTLMMQRISTIKAHPGSVALWTQLRQELNRHRSFPDANWAMPAAELEPLAAIYERLMPADPVQAHSWLFDGDPKLPEGTTCGDIKARFAQRDAACETAIAAAYQSGGEKAILSIAESAPVPRLVGRAFTTGVGATPALALVAKQFGSDNRKLTEMARGALYAIYCQSGWDGLEYALAMLKATNAQPPALAEVFLAAQSSPDTWQRLAEESPEVQRRYWEQLTTFSALQNDEATIRSVAEGLLEVQRSPAVVDWFAYMPLHHEIVIRTLEQLPADLATDKEPEPVTARIGLGIVTMLESLDKSSAVGDDVIARLELPLLPALPYGWRPNLAIYRVISNAPALFADLVASAYRRDDGQTDTTDNEQTIRISSEILAQIIIGAGVVPGKMKDGSVDYESLSNWVSEARRLCAERGRAEIGDEYIGHLLAKSPDGADGLWPCEPVREVLELLGPGAQHIGNGFDSGTFNLRGVTMRDPFAGGDQERALADKYQEQASMMASKWPHTAALLQRIADSYQRQAQWHDQKSDELDQFGF